MSSPPYHLRTNKAIDRFLFLEILRNVILQKESQNYCYVSFGGPYLDDFRLMHEYFPKMELISLEKCKDTFKRQKFNKPSGNVQLLNTNMTSYLSNFMPGDKKYVFWLDYTDLRYSNFEDFKSVLFRIPPGSIVKITLQCEPHLYINKQTDKLNPDGTFKKDKQLLFAQWFDLVLPNSYSRPPRRRIEFAKLLTKMIRIASQQALPRSATTNLFCPILDSFYKDKGGIYTFTGIVTTPSNITSTKDKLRHLWYSNLSWRKNPLNIDIPILSTKERLHLQPSLPCNGGELKRLLGYKIGDDSLKQLKQYSDFYREYPYFIRGII